MESDDPIYLYIGKFPLITAEEIAKLTDRNIVSLRKRLRRLTEIGYLGRIEGGEQRKQFFEDIKCPSCQTLVGRVPIKNGKIEPKPFFYWITEIGKSKVKDLLDNPFIRKNPPKLVDHDRVLTMMHLALDQVFANDMQWLQQKPDVRRTVIVDGETQVFYPDAVAILHGEEIPFEYANCEPSSDGEDLNDIVKKVVRYNEIMKDTNGKVVFIFRTSKMAENFVYKIAGRFPYLWPHITDIESFKRNPKGKIFWTPKDFDTMGHSLIE